MFKEIVVPLDGSDLSATALPIAYSMAHASGATVNVFAYAPNEREVQSLLVRIEDQVAVTNALYNKPGVTDINTSVSVPTKAIDLELQDEIAKLDNVLVCMSTHGRGRSAAIAGSVTNALLTRIDNPVMLVGPECDVVAFDPTGLLVVSIDASQTSEAVIPAATWWARKFDSPLEFVTVLEPYSAGRSEANNMSEATQVERLAHIAQTELKRPVNFEVLHSKKPAVELVERATASNASLLAMTTHATTGLARLASGSVTSDVVRHAKCPVLVLGSVA